jgi:flagellar export protein FliJ
MTSALATLLAHSERQRDAAQAAVSLAEQHAVRLADQGRQLTDYRAQCRRNGPTQPGRVTGIDALRAHQGLLERIEQALAQHTRQVAEAEAQIARRRDALLTLELRVTAVRQLLARRDAISRQAQARRDQRQSDDAVHARTRAAETDPPIPA